MLIRGQRRTNKVCTEFSVDDSVDSVNFAAAHNNMHMSLPGVGLICRLVFKQRPVTAEVSGVSRAKHFASLHLFALLTRQRHMHSTVMCNAGANCTLIIYNKRKNKAAGVV